MTTAALIPAARRPLAIQPHVTTWALFALVVVVDVSASLLFDRRVLTHDALQTLAYAAHRRVPGDTVTVDTVMALHAAAGVATLALRVGFVSLALQTVLLAVGVPARVGTLLRTAVVGTAVLVSGSALRSLWLLSQPQSSFTPGQLLTNPGSLAALVLPMEARPSPVYLLLNCVNPFELAWCFAVAWLLRRCCGGAERAAAVALGAWLALTLSQWGLTVLLPHLLRS